MDKVYGLQRPIQLPAFLSIYVGDGPNDQPALASTPHSVAIATGSALARGASNCLVKASTRLPDLVTASRMFHGGRAIVLRDIVFTGMSKQQ